MTRAESQLHWMKKTKYAYKHFHNEWFKEYKTGSVAWIHLQNGQGITSMHYLMFQTLIKMLATQE